MAKKAAPLTRKSRELLGMGAGITAADMVITGCRLPTYKQVLRCFLFYYEEWPQKDQKAQMQAADRTLELCKPHYECGGVVMPSDYNCRPRIIKFYNEYNKWYS